MHSFTVTFIVTAFALFVVPSKASTDTCTFFSNFDLTAALNSALNTAIPDIFGNINRCLCVSDIPAVVTGNSNIPILLAVDEAGMAATENALTTIVDTSPGAELCSYPDNSAPACSQSNPCGFTCASSFTLCNGICIASSICPSSGPSRRSFDEQYQLKRSGRRLLCPNGDEACGGYKGPKSYECIDITTTLDSCGGCVLPLLGKNSTGRDCSIIPGAENVRCHRSKCAVATCMTGWSVSEDGESCVLSKS